jgi:predicted CoA-binding protein
MNTVTSLLAEPGATIALVGATDNAHKYGSIIYRDLKRKGFPVFAVNPYRQTVDGDPAYATLADIPEAPTVVNFVVPPEETLRVLEEAHELGYTDVWIQPGAESVRVLEYLEDAGFNYLASSCIMVSAPQPAA